MKLSPSSYGVIPFIVDRIVVNKVRVCCSCGNFVDRWVGSIQTEKIHFRLCASCYPAALTHLIRGTLLGLMEFEDWEKNHAKQIAVENAFRASNLHDKATLNQLFQAEEGEPGAQARATPNGHHRLDPGDPSNPRDRVTILDSRGNPMIR